MHYFEHDTVVIGAGVVGLACAAALARYGLQPLVIERAGRFGEGISSRNSEVIHSGIYYPTASLKHRLCVRGRRLLYSYLVERGIWHRKLGKLVIASDSYELDPLQALHKHASHAGIEGIRLLGKDELRHLEPAVRGEAALLSAETGVLDGHGLMVALAADIESWGGQIVYRSTVASAVAVKDGFEVTLAGDEPIGLRCRNLINAAGLFSLLIAAQLSGGTTAVKREPRFVKGSYFSCTERSPFSHLIYPLPPRVGLGIHLTLDMNQRMRFGPDTERLPNVDAQQIDFAVDPARAHGFYESIRRYWPALPDDSLRPDYAGCRPRLAVDGIEQNDFMIEGPSVHGVAGLVNLLGIESPGLTSALAIAEEVQELLAGTR